MDPIIIQNEVCVKTTDADNFPTYSSYLESETGNNEIYTSYHVGNQKVQQ